MRKRSLDANPTDSVKSTTSWKNVPGVSGLLANDQGRIRRRDPKLGWTIPYQPKQEVAGYRRFYHEGCNYTVHRCVCLAFHGKPNEGDTPDHINKDRGDNRASNLRWASRHAQQLNRKRPRVQCNSKAVFARHPTWDANTPALWYGSSNLAGKALGCSGRTIRQSANSQGHYKARGFTITWAAPLETQDDLPGEEWRQVGPTLRVSSEGRVQTTSNGVWGYKRTPPVSGGVGYAKVLINKNFHDVLYRTFYPNTSPQLTIDHINRDKSCNRLCNLRAVTWAEQNRNKGHSKHQKLHA
jgi:hypothetical protein